MCNVINVLLCLLYRRPTWLQQLLQSKLNWRIFREYFTIANADRAIIKQRVQYTWQLVLPETLTGSIRYHLRQSFVHVGVCQLTATLT